MKKIFYLLTLSILILSSFLISGCLEDIDEEPNNTDEPGPDDFDHSRYTKVGITAEIIYKPINDTIKNDFINSIENNSKFFNVTDLNDGDY